MVKINAEEYEILKELDDKWKWIAKDDNYGGFIFCFREKPHKDIRKGGWSPDTTQYKCLWEYDSLFQFIQWEDEEPHNIQELIKEYEYRNEPVKLAGGLSITQAKYDKYLEEHIKELENESEEAELKDSEWLKKEIHKELEDWHGVEGGIDGDGINEIMLLINQHEESEVKRLDKKIRELESYNNELIRDNNQLRNELDSQEVLSSDWIAGKKMWIRNKIPFHMDVDYAVPVNDLQNLLVPKQEEVKIESVWAEDIKDAKASGMTLFEAMDWMAIDCDEKEKQDLFARAWLDGYTVEKEQKYILSINITDKASKTNYETFLNKRGIFHSMENETFNSEEFNWTEEEIKDLESGEILFEHFATKVEELEKWK